jgi:hypothetical protein
MAKRGIETRYYTPMGHLAAFALPGYVEKIVAEATGRSPGARRSRAKAGGRKPKSR